MNQQFLIISPVHRWLSFGLEAGEVVYRELAELFWTRSNSGLGTSVTPLCTGWMGWPGRGKRLLSRRLRKGLSQTDSSAPHSSAHGTPAIEATSASSSPPSQSSSHGNTLTFGHPLFLWS